MSELPDFFVSFWMSKIPHNGVVSMPKASLASAATWKIIKRSGSSRDMFPCLLDAKASWRAGIKLPHINAAIKGIKTGFVDERIRVRCDRWMSLNEKIQSQKEIGK